MGAAGFRRLGQNLLPLSGPGSGLGNSTQSSTDFPDSIYLAAKRLEGLLFLLVKAVRETYTDNDGRKPGTCCKATRS